MRNQCPSQTRRALTLLLAAAVTSASVGCAGAPAESPPADAASQLRSRVEFSAGDNRAAIELAHDPAAGVFRGTLVVTEADGSVHEQAIELPDTVEDSARPRVIIGDGGQRWVEAHGQRFEVLAYEEHEDRVEVVFAGVDGVEFRVIQYGPMTYALPALVVLGIVGIVLCGAAVIAHIVTCAAKDWCWDFAIGSIRNICGGSCVPCAPTPTPTATASATPGPTATATSTPAPTATATSTPSGSPSPLPTVTATAVPSSTP